MTTDTLTEYALDRWRGYGELDAPGWRGHLPRPSSSGALLARLDVETRRGGKMTGAPLDSRTVAHSTYAVRGHDGLGPYAGLQHHATRILTVRPGELYAGTAAEPAGPAGPVVIVDCAGWRSVTTAARLRDYLPAPYSIGSRRGQWHVFWGESTAVPGAYDTCTARRTRGADGKHWRQDPCTCSSTGLAAGDWPYGRGWYRDAAPAVAPTGSPLAQCAQCHGAGEYRVECWQCHGAGFIPRVLPRPSMVYRDGIELGPVEPIGLREASAHLWAGFAPLAPIELAAVTAVDAVRAAQWRDVVHAWMRAVAGQVDTMSAAARSGTLEDLAAGDCWSCVMQLGTLEEGRQDGWHGTRPTAADPMQGHWTSHVLDAYLPIRGAMFALALRGYRSPATILAYSPDRVAEVVARYVLEHVPPRDVLEVELEDPDAYVDDAVRAVIARARAVAGSSQ